MTFSARIRSLFGDVAPPSGVVSPSLLEEDFSEISSYRSSKLLSLVDAGSLVATFMCDLLISFFEEAAPSCRSMTWKVFLWKRTSSTTPPLKAGQARLVQTEGRTIKLLHDPFWEELFNESDSPNMSLARKVEEEVEGERKGWVVERGRYSNEPVVALAQAKREFGEEFGAISDGNRVFFTPSAIVDLHSLTSWVQGATGLDELRNYATYDTIKTLKDSFSYYMNVGGRVRDVIDSRVRSLSFFNKYVILPEHFDVSSLEEGIDYSVKAGVKVIRFPTLLEVLSTEKQKGRFFLKLSDSTLKVREEGLGSLREVSFKKTHRSDVLVQFSDSKEEMKVSYRFSAWKHEAFPLSCSETYSKSLLGDEVVLMVEP